MVSLKSLTLFAVAALATTVLEVIDDVTVLDSNVKALITQVNLYTGGILGATPQLTALTAVYASLFKGVIDTGLVPDTVSESEAFALIDHVNKTLVVDNLIAVKTLESKKDLYTAAGLDELLVGALGLLKVGHESFTTNVLKRAPEDAVQPAKEVALVISNALQDGIDEFEAS
jgi:hypothetical protein